MSPALFSVVTEIKEINRSMNMAFNSLQEIRRAVKDNAVRCLVAAEERTHKKNRKRPS